MYAKFIILSVCVLKEVQEAKNVLQEYDHEFAEFLYYTPAEIDKGSPFWLVRAGRNIAKPGYRIGPRRIECSSIHFVTEGSLMVEYKGQSCRLQAGDAFCMYPNETYLYYKPDDEPSLQLTWLAMDGPGMEKMLFRRRIYGAFRGINEGDQKRRCDQWLLLYAAYRRSTGDQRSLI